MLVEQDVRRITGFDRALVCRFDRDWHGTVLAEEDSFADGLLKHPEDVLALVNAEGAAITPPSPSGLRLVSERG